MRQYLKLLVFAISLGIILNSCDSSTAPSAYEQIYGKWKWVLTTGGRAGVHYTPDSVGYNCMIEFINTDICKIYKNSNLLITTKFEIQKASVKSPLVYILMYDFTSDEKEIVLDSLPNLQIPYRHEFNESTINTIPDFADDYISKFIKL